MNSDAIRIAWMVVAPLVSGILGGLGGAFIMGFKFGTWRTKVEGSVDLVVARVGGVESAVARVERRLDKGDGMLSDLPAFKSELEACIDELKETRKALASFVSRRECELRHSKGGHA